MPALIIASIIGYFFFQTIRKYERLIYGITFMITVVTVIMNQDVSELATGLMLVVMLTGVLPKKWKLTSRLKALRKPYAILSVLFLTSHVTMNLLSDFEWFGVFAYVIMIPLFVTSFNVVRKKLTPSSWKQLHKLSYIAYLLIFIHLIVVGEIIYLVIGVLYAFLFVLKLRQPVIKSTVR